MSRRRVVITGLGVVSSIGLGKEAFWRALLAGQSGIKRIRSFDASLYACQIAGEILDFPAEEFFPCGASARFSRASQLALVASQMALEDAHFDCKIREADRVGTVIGAGMGGAEVYENQLRRLIETNNPRRVHPWSVPLIMANAPAAEIAIRYGLKGPNMTISTACSSGAHAIGYGLDLIRSGRVDVMMAGGTEACIVPSVIAGFNALHALSVCNNEPERASRPFDRTRDGFAIGEGAGVLILETLESAKQRDVHIYAEVAGYAAACEACHIVHPETTGTEEARVMELALKDAEIPISQVDYINTHGTSTVLNDLTETNAIKKLFGPHAYRISLNSTKSMIGHTIGAAGAVEAIVCALTLQRKVLHPTINYENPDPDCDLDYTPNHAREKDVHVALSNSFGFGSNNACLVMKAFNKWRLI
jgi:3-oxoacyl-[acyl-carrier-protein] synthase II